MSEFIKKEKILESMDYKAGRLLKYAICYDNYKMGDKEQVIAYELIETMRLAQKLIDELIKEARAK